MQRERERIKAERAEQKRLAEEAKLQAGRRGLRAQSSQQDPNSPLKSALARKQGRSGSQNLSDAQIKQPKMKKMGSSLKDG